MAVKHLSWNQCSTELSCLVDVVYIMCNYWPQRSWAKVISLQASVCPQEGVWNFRGCLKFWGGVWNSPGGVWNFRRGVWNFQRGGFWNFGGMSEIFGGGSSKFFFVFIFFNFFSPQKKSFWDAPPLPPPRRSMRGRYTSYWNAFLFMTQIYCAFDLNPPCASATVIGLISFNSSCLKIILFFTFFIGFICTFY